MGKKTRIILSGRLMKAGERTGAGRIYPKEVLEREVQRLQGLVDETKLFATVDNDSAGVKLTKVAGRVEKVEMRGDYACADVELLATPPGEQIRRFIAEGEVALKPSGFGSVDEQGTVQDDYRMTHIAIVPEDDE